MPGKAVAVDNDIEVEVQPHRLGHRLSPGNPLSANGYVPQRYRLALTRRGAGDAAVVGERVDVNSPRTASLPAASTSNGAMASSGSNPSNNTICACTCSSSGERTAKDQWRIGHNSPTCCQGVDDYGWVTTGADVVIDRLIAGGVEVCFANPGTSEMHFVAALDSAPQMRAVLCPFEGVATGAADGYARIAGKPAATLLHLGPGMGNGLANLHNARRAHSPVINIVGDHATYHQKLDAPLQSDIDMLGHWLKGTVHRPESAAEVGDKVDHAITAATYGRGLIATLVLPADLSWSEAKPPGAAPRTTPPDALTSPAEDIWALIAQGYTNREIAEKLTVSIRTVEGHLYRAGKPLEILKKHGEHVVLLLGGPATTAEGLRAAARISAATGAKVLVETFPARLARGRGVPAIPRLGYFAEMAQEQLRWHKAFDLGWSAVAGGILRVPEPAR